MIHKRTIREVMDPVSPHLTLLNCDWCGYPDLSDENHVFTIDDDCEQLVFCSRRCATEGQRSLFEADRMDAADAGSDGVA